MQHIQIEPGMSIWSACQYAIDKAKKIQNIVKFTFNDIEIIARGNSNQFDLVYIYQLECEIRRMKYASYS